MMADGDEQLVTGRGCDVYDLGDELLPLAAVRNVAGPGLPPDRGAYSRGEIRLLVQEYARLYAGSAAPRSSWRTARAEMGEHSVLVRLWDLNRALSALPRDLYVAVELCGLRGMTFDEAGELLGVGRSTVNDRFSKGLKLLEDYLSTGTPSAVSSREVSWATWVSEDRHLLDPHPEAAFAQVEDSPHRVSRRKGDRPVGRPPEIPLALEMRIAALYRSGLTLQAIADLFEKEGVPAPGRKWRPSSLRRVLKRQGVEMRGRGRSPRKDSMAFATR